MKQSEIIVGEIYELGRNAGRNGIEPLGMLGKVTEILGIPSYGGHAEVKVILVDGEGKERERDGKPMIRTWTAREIISHEETARREAEKEAQKALREQRSALRESAENAVFAILSSVGVERDDVSVVMRLIVPEKEKQSEGEHFVIQRIVFDTHTGITKLLDALDKIPMDDDEPNDPDACDSCGARGEELYHDDATGLSLCDECLSNNEHRSATR